MSYYRKTCAEAFQLMEAKLQTPFIVMGDFLDDFYSADHKERQRMIDSPLPLNSEQWEWLVYFVAAIDLLCFRFSLIRPEWVGNPNYHLREPWFLFDGWRLRAWQLITTPVPFKMRNIFTGDNILTRV